MKEGQIRPWGARHKALAAHYFSRRSLSHHSSLEAFEQLTYSQPKTHDFNNRAAGKALLRLLNSTREQETTDLSLSHQLSIAEVSDNSEKDYLHSLVDKMLDSSKSAAQKMHKLVDETDSDSGSLASVTTGVTTIGLPLNGQISEDLHETTSTSSGISSISSFNLSNVSDMAPNVLNLFARAQMAEKSSKVNESSSDSNKMAIVFLGVDKDYLKAVSSKKALRNQQEHSLKFANPCFMRSPEPQEIPLPFGINFNRISMSSNKM